MSSRHLQSLWKKIIKCDFFRLAWRFDHGNSQCNLPVPLENLQRNWAIKKVGIQGRTWWFSASSPNVPLQVAKGCRRFPLQFQKTMGITKWTWQHTYTLDKENNVTKAFRKFWSSEMKTLVCIANKINFFLKPVTKLFRSKVILQRHRCRFLSDTKQLKCMKT